VSQVGCYHHIQFSDSFSATPETPLPSPPQGSGQEQYKITANQASVISHQPLSKQKQLWENVYFWMALQKCEKLLVLKYLRIVLLAHSAKAPSWCCFKMVSYFPVCITHFVYSCFGVKLSHENNVYLSLKLFVLRVVLPVPTLCWNQSNLMYYFHLFSYY
jgi:hypothetical protein